MASSLLDLGYGAEAGVLLCGSYAGVDNAASQSESCAGAGRYVCMLYVYSYICICIMCNNVYVCITIPDIAPAG
jgi:hypothetical protein